MKMSKVRDAQDTRKGQQRYIDQPGQWTNTTPKAVQARQDRQLKALAESLNKKAPAKKKTTAKKAK